MKLYFWRGKEPNFGDELNTWLLPKVFPNFFDNDSRTLFLGIGSVLFDYHPPNCQKVVFGAGFVGYTPPPQLNKSWTVYCVRGPRTAKVCGLGQEKVAADTAILINRFLDVQHLPQLRRIGFMPHFDNLNRGNWQKACRLAGLHFIDPRCPVDKSSSRLGAVLLSSQKPCTALSSRMLCAFHGCPHFRCTHLIGLNGLIGPRRLISS